MTPPSVRTNQKPAAPVRVNPVRGACDQGLSLLCSAFSHQTWTGITLVMLWMFVFCPGSGSGWLVNSCSGLDQQCSVTAFYSFSVQLCLHQQSAVCHFAERHAVICSLSSQTVKVPSSFILSICVPRFLLSFENRFDSVGFYEESCCFTLHYNHWVT